MVKILNKKLGPIFLDFPIKSEDSKFSDLSKKMDLRFFVGRIKPRFTNKRSK